VPALMAHLVSAGGSSDDVERDLRQRVETLILEGDVEQWRLFLREAAGVVAEYAGDDLQARSRLASILDDQFLLTRAVLDLEPADLAARADLARAGATPPRSSRV
jgi:hypothetical protein